VVGLLATLITMSGFGDHHPGLRDHDDRNAQLRQIYCPTATASVTRRHRRQMYFDTVADGHGIGVGQPRLYARDVRDGAST
jgi:hypothetical protein